MQETQFIWMDGSFVSWKDANVHILNHSLHYGSAVFEGIRFYETNNGPAIFRLKEHVERLFNSAATLNMKIPFSKEDIEKAIIETVKVNKISSGYIRPLVYHGYGKMGLSLKGAPINVSISCWPWGAYLGEKPIKVKISDFIRIHPKSSLMSAKISGHYTNSILAGEEVRSKGYDEALLLDYKGDIAEGPGENFFIVKNNVIITPPLGSILPGITRDSIIKIAHDLGIKFEEKPLKPKDAYNADETFFTGTAAEVTSIESIDDKKLKEPPGKVTSKLKSCFDEIVKGKNKKYKNWLTFVN